MNIKSFVACFILMGVVSAGFAQKIKYKDLFVLLNAKRYTEAEPFLKKYLKDNTTIRRTRQLLKKNLIRMKNITRFTADATCARESLE